MYFDLGLKLTPEQCHFLRELRREGGKSAFGYSWRALAREFVDKYQVYPDLRGNQLFGMDLCEMAAAYFKENPHGDPWN